MQIFSLHWMMQNIRLFNVCEDIKKLMFYIYNLILSIKDTVQSYTQPRLLPF